MIRRKDRRKPYIICQKCGAHLDYGERCECEQADKAAEVKEGKDGFDKVVSY